MSACVKRCQEVSTNGSMCQQMSAYIKNFRRFQHTPEGVSTCQDVSADVSMCHQMSDSFRKCHQVSAVFRKFKMFQKMSAGVSRCQQSDDDSSRLVYSLPPGSLLANAVLARVSQGCQQGGDTRDRRGETLCHCITVLLYHHGITVSMLQGIEGVIVHNRWPDRLAGGSGQGQ